MEHLAPGRRQYFPIDFAENYPAFVSSSDSEFDAAISLIGRWSFDTSCWYIFKLTKYMYCHVQLWIKDFI